MKTIKNLVLAITVMGLWSCDKELGTFQAKSQNENPDPKEILLPGDDVSLKFTVHTEEDQMGKFAENAMVEFAGKVWSVGGINSYSDPNLTNGVWSSINGKNWISVTSGLFDERKKHTLTVYDGKMWLIGGVNNSGSHLSDVWNSTDGESWVLATDTPAFGSAAYHSTVVFDGRLFVIEDEYGGYVKVWSSSDGVLWSEESSMAFSAREDFDAVVFDGAIYVLGGNHTTTKYNEIWNSSDGINWSQVTTTSVFSPRNLHTTTVHNGKVWVIGGNTTGGYVLDFWYSDNMSDWTEYTGTLPSTEGLFDHAALDYNGELWLFGGYQDEISGIRRIGSIRSIWEE